MAFRAQDLSVISYANGFTLFHYRTGDPANEVDDAGYFDEASSMLRVGDFILVNAGIGGIPGHGVMVVMTSGNGTADVSNLLPFATVNAD